MVTDEGQAEAIKYRRRLEKATKRYRLALEHLDEARSELDLQMLLAARASVKKTEIHRITGLTRPTIDRVLGTTQKRRSE